MSLLHRAAPRKGALACSLWLAALGCGDPVEEAIEGLITGGAAAEAARMELNLAKGSAVAPLIAALQDSSYPPRARADIAEALYRLYLREENKAIVRALLGGLDAHAPAVRRATARWLGNLRRAEATTPLLARLERERDDEVRLELLLAIEMMNTVAEGGDAFYNTVVTTDKFTGAEFARFIRATRALAAEPLPDALAAKTREWLAFMVQERIAAAERLQLKADLAGAEALLAEARSWMPDGININYQLGKFHYDNGDRAGGLAIFDTLGLALRPAPLPARPQLDGRLDEPAWAGVEPVRRFYKGGIPKMLALPADGRSEAYLGYYGDALYVAVRGYETSTANLAATAVGRDAHTVWQDDCVELFLDTDRDARTYYHFMVNSLGTLADAYQDGTQPFADIAWSGEFRVGVDVAATHWTAEIELPAEQFPGARIGPGAVWGFNVARIRIANSTEYAQWAPTYESAHRPARFGLLIFE